MYWSHTDFQYMRAASVTLSVLPENISSSRSSSISIDHRFTVPLTSLYIFLFVRLCYTKIRERSTRSTIQSCLCLRKLTFMLDSAAPHAIHKSNIIDPSSNSRLFQQTGRSRRGKKEKKRNKSRFKVCCVALTDKCTSHLLFLWLRLSAFDKNLLFLTAGLDYYKSGGKGRGIQLPLWIYIWRQEN